MKLRITIEDKTYEVDVEVAEPEARPMIGTAGPARSGGGVAPRSVSANAAPTSNVPDDKAVKSPLAGVVSAVEAQPGQEVEADQPLLVLEAMKMLTTITAPNAGKVKDIFVKVGDGVKQGQVLVEFE